MDLFIIIISLVILLFSAILHEIAHGFVADRLGDPTARLAGRLTLNPKPHIDLYMSIILPLVLFIGTQGQFIFGGAKPVPVDPFNLKDGKKDVAMVSLAGPLTNILLAILASILLHLFFPETSYNNFFYFSSLPLIQIALIEIVKLNLILAIFNLFPIPPLDGSKVFASLLPEREANAFLSIGEFGTFIIFFLLFFPIGPFSLQSLLTYLHQLFASLLGFTLQ